MTQIRSPYCVIYMGVCIDPLACVTEFCSHGSLCDLLKGAAQTPELAAELTWERRLKMALQGALGMAHLHANGIVHRDLKVSPAAVGARPAGLLGMLLLMLAQVHCACNTGCGDVGWSSMGWHAWHALRCWHRSACSLS